VQSDDEPLDCEEAIHTLYHYLDGELTEVRRVEIRHHLDDCLPCLEAFDFEAELRIVIARKCRDEVPESLRERVAKAISHEATSHGGDMGDGIPKL
jgi:mycothiol system anti-sigma-R factor